MFLNPSAPLKTLLYCSESFKTSPYHSRISFTFQNHHKPFRLYHDLTGLYKVSGPFYSFQHDSAHLKSFLEQSKTFQELVRLFQTNKDLSELWKLSMSFTPFRTFWDLSGPFRPFRKIQDLSRPFRNFQVVSRPSRMFHTLHYLYWTFTIFQNNSRPLRTFQHLSGPSKTIQELSSPFKTFKELNKLPKCFIPCG